jgi:ATP-dependent Lhr-like helicase
MGWPLIQKGENTLIAAPTGSGKTLTAFMVCIDRLLRDGLEGKLKDQTRVLYISPLKALSNDIRANLEQPLAEIEACADKEGFKIPTIRALVRTGDTPASQRQAMVRRPPHILVTTPESLFLLLTGEKSREILRTIDTVIVDEIHALARDKRGSHFSLSLERLNDLCDKPPVRIGLSATQKPIDQIANFLTGMDDQGLPRPCHVVDVGHQRDLDLAVEVPPSELSAVCSNEQWEEIYLRLKELIESHRSTLVFVNTRKMAERVAFHLTQHLGENAVASHHGSLSKDRRLDSERRLKAGELKVIVATASLELGIDIGFIDLVCQMGSPRSIATFLQRIGRSGHAVKATPKGRLFAMTRDELVESQATIRAVHLGRLDAIEIPQEPLDILAQQIIAASACDEWDEDALFALMKHSYPYRNLQREPFDQVMQMLAEGYTRGKFKTSYLHRDIINKKVRGRRGARLAAITSGGAIPEQADYRVVDVDDGSFIGTLNEDFAIESSAGDIFLLGNTSWQITHVRGTEVGVRDANGAPPSIPFWLGEAPGRTIELSNEVSLIREEVSHRLNIDPEDPVYSLEVLSSVKDAIPPAYQEAMSWLNDNASPNDWANLQIIHYFAVQKAALGLLPTQKDVVFERFFDDTGGMQLVIHSPYGMRINRGFGLALRKSFCRSFDFELQASADDEGIVLSVGPHQSFPIEQLFKFLNPDNIQGLIEQALLQVPFFQIRWRWNANRSLAVLRSHSGKRVPPALQRFRSDDLLTATFPASTQCLEHVTGDIEFPDHPLVNQTLKDCLSEAIDIVRLKEMLHAVKEGAINYIARDTREPSPFSYQMLNANPYAFLDDAPLEERRARAISQRRTLSIETLRDLTALDEQAIIQVRREAWPLCRDADELHDVLNSFGALSKEYGAEWQSLYDQLEKEGRAATCKIGTYEFWFAAENLNLVKAAWAGSEIHPEVSLPGYVIQESYEPEDARLRIIEGFLDSYPIISTFELARILNIPENHMSPTLSAIEARGSILRGHFTGSQEVEWCHRRLLVRIHRLTLDGLRQQIKPVPVHQYFKFLLKHHGMLPGTRKDQAQGVAQVIHQLQGFEAPAGSWESEIIPTRMNTYRSHWLDELCHAGQVRWGRLRCPKITEEDDGRGGSINRAIPITLFMRENTPWLVTEDRTEEPDGKPIQRSESDKVYTTLQEQGALFTDEIKATAGLLDAQLDRALADLARLGLITADGFEAIRRHVDPHKKRKAEARRGLGRRFQLKPSLATGGRWSLFPGKITPTSPDERVEQWAMLLLVRYGIVFRDVVTREKAAPSWGQLVRVYRRLEALSEVRGGRFVSGVSGEQYALNDAVDILRKVRDENDTGSWSVISAADPLNLIGVLTDGPKLSSARLAKFILKDGRHVATYDNGEVTFHVPQDPETSQKMRRALSIRADLRLRDETLQEPIPAEQKQTIDPPKPMENPSTPVDC